MREGEVKIFVEDGLFIANKIANAFPDYKIILESPIPKEGEPRSLLLSVIDKNHYVAATSLSWYFGCIKKGSIKKTLNEIVDELTQAWVRGFKRAYEEEVLCLTM